MMSGKSCQVMVKPTIIDPQAGSEAMGLLILQEIAPTEKTVLLKRP